MKYNYYGKFDIKIRDHYGSNNTAIVFSRLMYWFNKKPEGFYKFKQPCKKHPLYRSGDSWGEELMMSRKILDPIMARLVTYYKTKKAFLLSSDRFKGKIFASYTNHKTNQTHYIIDWKAYSRFIEQIGLTKPKNAPSPSMENVQSSKEAISLASDHSSDVPLGHPLARAHIDHTIQTITSLSNDGKIPTSSPPSSRFTEEEKLISKEMVGIWNASMNDKIVWLPGYVSRLCEALKYHFNGCLKRFKYYCSMMASSAFLKGESLNSKFKAFLFWAIKPEIIQRIINGAYGIKKILSFEQAEQKKISQVIKRIDDEIAIIDHKISQHENEIREGQKKQINEYKQNLTKKEVEKYRRESDEEFKRLYPEEQEIADKDSAFLLNLHFDGPRGYLVRKIKEELGMKAEIVCPPYLATKKYQLLMVKEILLGGNPIDDSMNIMLLEKNNSLYKKYLLTYQKITV